MSWISKHPYLILTLLVCATCLPFVNQAVHIDDPIYLEVAENILHKPFFPYDYRPIFEGFQADDAASHSHLPLTSYYLAAVKLVSGSDSEWIFHLAFMVFPLLAAWAMYDLAARFLRFPLGAAALLVVSPVFVVISHTLMTDIPLLGFWILAFSKFIAIFDGQVRRGDWTLLTLALLAAAFISVMTAIAAGIFLASMLIWHRPKGLESRRKLLVILAAPFVVWVAWFALAYVHYGRFVLVNTVLHMNQRDAFSWDLFGSKALVFILDLGALFLMPLVAWVAFSVGFRWRIALLAFVVGFVPFFTWVTDWSWPEILIFAVSFSTGLLVFMSMVASAARREWRPVSSTHSRGFWVLLLWFGGVVTSCLFVYYAGSARYALPALPLVLLVAAKHLEIRFKDTYLLRNLLATAVVLTAAYSLWLGYADYRFADAYRQAARELPASYGQNGRTVWVAGEWGFRYYMNRAGARTLLQTGTEPRAGDIIVKPYVAMPWVTLYDSDEYTELVEQRLASADYEGRILDFTSHAGFYSSGWGILPFSVKKGERWERFNVFRVKKEYQGAVPEQQRPW